MREGDPHPIEVEKLTSDMFVGDVITAPLVTPMIEAARKVGCGTSLGVGMFKEVNALMIRFLLDAPAPANG